MDEPPAVARTGDRHVEGAVRIDRERLIAIALSPVDLVVSRAVENHVGLASADQCRDRGLVRDRRLLVHYRRLRSEPADELRPQLPPGAENERFQSALSSCGSARPACCTSIAVISSSGAGRPTRKPCAASQPASTRTASAIRSCKPSATTRSPRL